MSLLGRGSEHVRWVTVRLEFEDRLGFDVCGSVVVEVAEFEFNDDNDDDDEEDDVDEEE